MPASILQVPLASTSNNCQAQHQCGLHFNGVDQSVVIERSHGFDASAFSFETWFNWSGAGNAVPDGYGPNSGGIPLISVAGSSSAEINLFIGIQASSGVLMAVFKDEPSTPGSPAQYSPVFGSSPVKPGAWHHAAATFDGQTWALYLDGRLDASLTLKTPAMPQLSGPQPISLAATSGGFFQGDLDEVRIWETARSQSELIADINLQDIQDSNLSGHWSMNDGVGSTLQDSSRSNFQGQTVNNPAWTDGAPFNLAYTAPRMPEAMSSQATANTAPNPPALVAPANAATGLTSPVTLTVTASDPNGGNVNVTFYGRPAGGTVGPDFTLAVLPDTQKYATNGLGIFGVQTQYIVNQQAAQNIVFVSHLGDMGDDWNVPSEWNIVNAAMTTLESAGIPYGIGIGNCDEDNWGVSPVTDNYFLRYFPASRFAGRAYYGGSYNGDNGDSYQLFSASGMDFIVINLKYNLSIAPESAAVLSWANGLLQTYSSRRAIVVTHNLLNTDTNITFSTDGGNIYNALKGNPNFFLMLGGHLDTEEQRQDPGTDGHTIYSLRSDYQTRTNGGNGWMRLMRFSPSTNKIYVTTYSPYIDQYETDADSKFSLNYTMNTNPFQVIGTASVPSGSNASVNWSGLSTNGQYEWFASVDDGLQTTNGPTWTFSTSSGSTTAPLVTAHPANQTVIAGQMATFSAAASGSPVPTVQWQTSTDSGATWTNIGGATSATYSFSTQAVDNGKQFRAVFTNTAGSATSSAAILTVNTAPAVTTQPASQTVNAGVMATFTAAASGSPAPTVQWQVSTNGGSTWNNIVGATATTYSFTTQATDNSKQFRAVFTNAAGSASSNAAILTVNSAPAVTTQPGNQTVIAGQTVTFTAAASGLPAPTVQWQVSTNGGVTWSNISGATSTPYTFTTQATDNAKQFKAVFTNTLGSVTSNAAILTVNTAPVVSTQPSNLTVNAGQTATFSATASGSPAPTAQWQVSSDGSSWSNITGATSTTYSFTAQAADNGKQFHVIFTNTAGSATTNAANLIVNSIPVVTTQPASQTVTAGQMATFSAAASGAPAPTVQWQVSTDNGVTWGNISGATSTIYTFTTQATDNAKQFRAFFTNTAGTATSNAAILTVNTVPVVTAQPASQTVSAGQTATFSAAASGSPAPTVQWQSSSDNGTTWSNISGATSATYSFATLAADNGKQFHAVFTNPAGSVTSNAAILTVNSAPVVTTQPASQTVTAGQMATFSAAASGAPASTVQWQVSTNSGSTWGDVTGATTTTYSFTAQAGDNGKQFRAVFTNAAGSATSNAATLTVNTLPVITAQPANQTVNAGQMATYTAAASGSPAPSVQWQGSTDGGLTWSTITGATSTTYSFTAQAGDNGKRFQAVFTNPAGSATSAAATLTVNVAPVVTTQPTNQTVTAGQTAAFNAAASGSPAPTVTWQGSTDGGVTWSNITGATSTPYSFTALVTDNGDQFRAVFTNTAGSATSNAAILTVNSVPVVTTQPANQTVNAGQMATFSAAASGSPAPIVQWQGSTDGGVTWSNIAGATSTTYSFTAQATDNGDQFRAVFTNTAGSAISNAAILTVNSAPVVTTQPANQAVVAGQLATFSAAASGLPAPTVQWQVSPDGTSWSNITAATSPSYSFTAQLTDNNKRYRAVFTNPAGSATTTAALLTVNNDLIFTDAFNMCNATAWTGGTVNSASLAFNTASGRNSTCGMAVTFAGGKAAYVVDNSPAAEANFHARYYFNLGTVNTGRNNAVTTYAAYNASGTMVLIEQLRYSGSVYQLRSGALSDSSTWTYTNWSTIGSGWHSVEVEWHAATSATISNGSLSFWIDGNLVGSATTINNDLYRIEKVSLGAVQGMKNTMSGKFFIDDYDSHRQTYIGP